jgi:predicted phosphodiesterase
MADSHGVPSLIQGGLQRLTKAGCRFILHLGDICDSDRPWTAAACVALLERHAVLAVCGNNDQALVAAGGAIAREARRWLAGLPLMIETPSALFVHSRADLERLGKAAMIRDLDDESALGFLKRFPGRLLFRGHSHHAAIRCRSGGGLTRLPPPILDGPALRLPPGAVVTCESLLSGSVWVWEPLPNTLRRLSPGGPG